MGKIIHLRNHRANLSANTAGQTKLSEKDAVKLKFHDLDHIYVTCTSMQANDHLSKLTTDLLNTITESDTIVA